MLIHFKALPTEDVRRLQHGGPDAYGFTPERKMSDGDGVPCRHCLRNVAAGHEYLILAYRPFPALQPYAETGPIFLHAEECERAPESDALPDMFKPTPDYIVRGYGADDRIVYGSGAVVPTRPDRGARTHCWSATTSPTCTCARPATIATSAVSSAGEASCRLPDEAARHHELPQRVERDAGKGGQEGDLADLLVGEGGDRHVGGNADRRDHQEFQVARDQPVPRSRWSRKVRRLLSRKLLVTAASAASVCDTAKWPVAASAA